MTIVATYVNMKRTVAIIVSMLMTAVSWASSGNLEVWGEVRKADDGKYYLTMYKNFPAEVTARFHFKYKGGGLSENYDLYMADSIAELHDPVPVEKAVKKVIIEDLFYTATDAQGARYTTDNPNDPMLNSLLYDLFDIYTDVFWFDNLHRAAYYDGRHLPDHLKKWRPDADDIDLKELDSDDLLLGIAAVAAAGIGMGVIVSDYWNVADSRYPYFSIDPQIQYFFDSGYMRDVIRFKYRFGNKGGWNLFADLGGTNGTANEYGMFDGGFTWSIGAGLDLGNFSMTLNGKPAFYANDDNFCAAQLGYDFQIADHFGIGLKAGAAVLSYDGEYYLDYPVNLGLFWRF